MEKTSLFLKNVGDNPRMRVLQYLIEGRDFDYTLTDMLHAGVSWGTINSLIPQLLALEIIFKTRTIGRATLYRLNKENETAKHLIALYDSLILEQLRKKQEKYLLTA